jgi:hypothetical protein
MFAGRGRGANEQATRFSSTLSLTNAKPPFPGCLGTAKSNRRRRAHTHQSIIPMDNTFDKTAVETIDLLEARLKRIENAVCGHVGDSGIPSNKPSASKRLADLEHSLHQLASKSRVVQDLLRLRESPWVGFQTSC